MEAQYETGVAERRPGTIERTLGAIRARYREMSRSQRRLADYVLKNPYQAAFASAASIGGQAGVSSATVVRFAEFLGLDGYTDLQEIARDALRREANEVIEFKRSSTVLTGQSTLHRCLREDIENIERTAGLIEEATFGKAVRLVARSRAVHIAGLRSNFGLAHQLAFNLNLIGRQAFQLSPSSGDLPEQLLRMRAGEVCIAISFRRYARQIIEILRHARASGLRVIAITDSEISPVAELADIAFAVSVKFPSCLESRAAALGVMNALVMGVALDLGSATAAALGRHEELWKRLGIYLEEPSRSDGRGSHRAAFEALEAGSAAALNGVKAGPRKARAGSRASARPE